MAASPPRIVLRHGPRCLAKRAVRACARRAPLGGLALHHAQRVARAAAAHRVRAPVFLGVLDRVPAPEDPQQRLTHRGLLVEARRAIVCLVDRASGAIEVGLGREKRSSAGLVCLWRVVEKAVGSGINCAVCRDAVVSQRTG